MAPATAALWFVTTSRISLCKICQYPVAIEKPRACYVSSEARNIAVCLRLHKGHRHYRLPGIGCIFGANPVTRRMKYILSGSRVLASRLAEIYGYHWWSMSPQYAIKITAIGNAIFFLNHFRERRKYKTPEQTRRGDPLVQRVFPRWWVHRKRRPLEMYLWQQQMAENKS